jgi:hypothetical protein
VAGASMGIEAEVAPMASTSIKIISEGYPSFSFKIDELDKNPKKKELRSPSPAASPLNSRKLG